MVRDPRLQRDKRRATFFGVVGFKGNFVQEFGGAQILNSSREVKGSLLFDIWVFEVVDEVSEVEVLRLEILVVCNVRDFRHGELQV